MPITTSACIKAFSDIERLLRELTSRERESLQKALNIPQMLPKNPFKVFITNHLHLGDDKFGLGAWESLCVLTQWAYENDPIIKFAPNPHQMSFVRAFAQATAATAAIAKK